MLRPGNVATPAPAAPAPGGVAPAPPLSSPGPGTAPPPATAATVFVPASVPTLGLVPIATVIFPVNPVAVLPPPSCAVIWTAGVIAAPATVFVGWTLKPSAGAPPAVMVNAELVPTVRLPLPAVRV